MQISEHDWNELYVILKQAYADSKIMNDYVALERMTAKVKEAIALIEKISLNFVLPSRKDT